MAHRLIYLVVTMDMTGEEYSVLCAYTTEKAAYNAKEELEKQSGKERDNHVYRGMIYDVETVTLNYV